MPLRRSLFLHAALALASLPFAAAAARADEPPQVDSLPSTQALARMPRKAGERVAVTIYEFRSDVAEIPARGTTDMFKTALMQSGQFRVVERARLNEGVVREKQLNGAGQSTGQAAAVQLIGARYVVEGAITEATASETQRSGAVRIAGAELGSSRNRDQIGLDVRMVDVESGEVVSAVTVRKALDTSTRSVSGLGNVLANVVGARGHSTTFVPDAQFQTQRKESLDVALRAAIDQAVAELVRRMPQ